jgi:hypothetical protein
MTRSNYTIKSPWGLPLLLVAVGGLFVASWPVGIVWLLIVAATIRKEPRRG